MTWQFWIDVGGTFTDCLALDDAGKLRRAKVLSSGATKGKIEPPEIAGGESSAARIVDARRRADPPDFWRGAALALLDPSGATLAEGRVSAFDASNGTLALEAPLAVAPRVGCTYELRTGDEAPIVAIRTLFRLAGGEPIPRCVVRLGTTRGTNALLTRRGAKTGFVTTRGFADVLLIGTQNRPKLFALDIVKPTPLFARAIEVDERIAASGEVLRPLDEESARASLRELRAAGIESLAIALLHGAKNPVHERTLGRIAREVGFASVSLSHETAALMKLVARGDTTLLDAYLNPILADYVARLKASLGESELRLMTSAGGLVSAGSFRGKDSILSGPAGGVVGFSKAALAAGFAKAVGFDMGGTSTDVSRFDGSWAYEFETEKAGVRVVAPMMAVETVAAGGGSVCGFDGVKLVVGPDSAGADPGPACYGRGGPLTVTDVNVFLGRLAPDRFPFSLDVAAVEARLAALVETIAEAAGKRYTPVELAAGFVRVANANMARPIRTISVAKGYDPREFALVSFGGAAGQHACAVADELSMTKVLVPPDAGLLSALGIGMADLVRHREQGIYRPFDPTTLAELEAVFTRLEDEARDELVADGASRERVTTIRRLDLRYAGLDAAITIARPTDGDYLPAYEREHQRLYGWHSPGRAVEVVAARVEAIARTPDPPQEPLPASTRPPEARRDGTIHSADGPRRAAIYDRVALAAGDRVAGPAIVCDHAGTTVVDPGWAARVLPLGELLLERTEDLAADDREITGDGRHEDEPPAEAPSDPVLLEIFNNQFAGVAEEMGAVLKATSSSVNVKERLDYSCAIFTPDGKLVVNAPHIPVHLGAMSLTVRALLEQFPEPRPGDVYITNDPFRGGSHLPDVTVVTPVHDETNRLVFFTASRAHHAELGGIAPGSMPPFSKNLAEEGVLIRGFKLFDAGEPRWDELERILSAGQYPSRNVRDNLADVRAQIAANRRGVDALRAMIARSGLALVHAYMRHIQTAAERKTRVALAKAPQGVRAFVDHLDDGSRIQVALTIDNGSVVIDFTGTSPTLAGNLNANRAITSSAALYCLRLLIDEDIPLNEGVLAPATLVIPQCLLNPSPGPTPEESPAVVGGNVETSQRVVDVLLGALGLAAASQGTMNNFTFGDGSFGYYETICGGAGATANAPGADAVHTHMTNTRLTDPEVLEHRFPVRLVRFQIRRGSGGAGKQRGGDGVIRTVEFLKPLRASLLTQRRGPHAPYGADGGKPGALGRNTLRRASSRDVVEDLGSAASFEAQTGDELTIETPGGGGWGSPDA